MMGRFARVGALLAALAVVGSRPTAAAIPNLPAQVSDSTIAAALREAQQLYDENKLDQAARRFDEVLGVAVAAGNRVAERQAHDGRGLVLMEKAEYSAARANFERALELAEGTGDRASVPVTQRHLARLFTLTGEWPRARELWRLALAELESRADLAGQARVLFEMSFDEKQGPAEIERTLSRAEVLASQVGDTKLLAGIHHAVGDHAFTRGDFATAIEHLERAIALYESVSATRDLARTLTSLGRLHRAHGHADIALDLYRRALKIQSDVGDEQGVIQSTNAIGVALGALGRSREALEYYGRALTLARRTGSARIVAFQLGNLAGAYIEVGEYDKAVDLLREVLREPQSAYLTSIRENQLSVAYLRLRRYQDAIDAASRSIAAARSEGRLPEMLLALGSRAVASRSMGRPAEALIDYREAMQALEEQRSRLIPTDFMKQGFSTQYQQVFAETIDLLHAIGRDDEALETAEAARARALLDLLASHGVHE